jgi:hypothetical protein
MYARVVACNWLPRKGWQRIYSSVDANGFGRKVFLFRLSAMTIAQRDITAHADRATACFPTTATLTMNGNVCTPTSSMGEVSSSNLGKKRQLH